jgi:hypothetical protein
MDTLPADLFTDPVWHALTSQHSHLAVIEGDARRYPVNVAPFAALAKPTELALWELHSLLVCVAFRDALSAFARAAQRRNVGMRANGVDA